MSFAVWVDYTENSRPLRARLGGIRPDTWPEVEQMVRDFHAGEKPMEGTLTFNDSQPGMKKSFRWADAKNIWIEEA